MSQQLQDALDQLTGRQRRLIGRALEEAAGDLPDVMAAIWRAVAHEIFLSGLAGELVIAEMEADFARDRPDLPGVPDPPAAAGPAWWPDGGPPQ